MYWCMTGADFPGMPGNPVAAVKAEAMHTAIKAKSGTPPPQEHNPLACQVS